MFGVHFSNYTLLDRRLRQRLRQLARSAARRRIECGREGSESYPRLSTRNVRWSYQANKVGDKFFTEGAVHRRLAAREDATLLDLSVTPGRGAHR